MKLTSPSFADGSPLMFCNAYEAENRSPALAWADAPAGVASFALVCQDRDGPGGRVWTHWVMWNIPAIETRLPAGLPQYERLENGTTQGLNDYLEFGWGGPCPPEGVHTYSFTLYALSSHASPATPTVGALLDDIAGRTIATARIEATYETEHRISSLVSIRRGQAETRVGLS